MSLKYVNIVLAIMIALLIGMAIHAYADNSIQACLLNDGTVMYTNKDVKGCSSVNLPELSIVPSYDKQLHTDRTLEHNPTIKTDILPTPPPLVVTPTVNPLITDTCALYHEWVNINAKSQGGLRGNSIDMQQRRVMLTMIFGSGFSPSMCRE